MLIVSGRLYLRSGTRERFLAGCAEDIALARGAPGCLDFVVAPDPIEADRVNVYEEWSDAAALEKFRQDGPGDSLYSLIVRAEVQRHEVSSSGPP